ncbi:MAG TPA: hypothetical protein PLA45_02855 [Candidatus Dojkabacteria bacterium]|nr:hypothetical protein [Candidatus Dojkabacteria bacterium]HOR05928.1 hypothetical protein [Candidatus Dojkabacteria bacterium]
MIPLSMDEVTSTTTLSEQLQEQPVSSTTSLGSVLIASLSISLFLVIGYLLIKWFKF